MGNPINLPCNEAPRNWNMMKKGTNTLRKVWVPVSQALSLWYRLGLLDFLRLWKIDGHTLTFISHLTKIANFFLWNYQTTVNNIAVENVIYNEVQQWFIFNNSLQIVLAPSSYEHIQQINMQFFSKAKQKLKLSLTKEKFVFYISLRRASFFSRLVRSYSKQPLSHATVVDISYKVNASGKLSWVLKNIISQCLKLYSRWVKWRNHTKKDHW